MTFTLTEALHVQLCTHFKIINYAFKPNCGTKIAPIFYLFYFFYVHLYSVYAINQHLIAVFILF